MTLKEGREGIREVYCFVEEFREEFGRSERRRNCGQYITGLLLPCERKSIAPLSEAVSGSDVQSLQQFINQSPWDEQAVQQKLRGLMKKRLRIKDSVLVIDDTGIPKKGKYSVGVAPQYCGALGKVANCQNIVTLHCATTSNSKIHFPIAAELYLPKHWLEDTNRLEKCQVPSGKRIFQEKWKIAINLIDTVKDQIPFSCVVFDAGYGEIRPFLKELDKRNLTFIGQVPESHSFWSVNTAEVSFPIHQMGRPRKHPAISDKSNANAIANTAKKWGQQLFSAKSSEKLWKTITLPSKQKVQAYAFRVYEVTTGAYYRPGPERWLIIEKLSDGTIRYFVSNAPKNASLKRLITQVHTRWTVEQGYQHLKSEIGLDHFEGRSWKGLHHHVTVCFMAYCFLLLWQRSKKNLPSHFPQLENSS